MVKKLKLEELNRINIKAFKKTEKIPLIVILDNVRSMHNVGAIFRTSDAFLVKKILLCGITPYPPHREIHKVALGATESVDWEYKENIKEVLLNLKTSKYQIIGVEQTNKSKTISNFEFSKNQKYALILGNEVEGLSNESLSACDDFIEIPQYGTKHSLNVSVCAGIIIWNFFEKLIYK